MMLQLLKISVRHNSHFIKNGHKLIKFLRIRYLNNIIEIISLDCEARIHAFFHWFEMGLFPNILKTFDAIDQSLYQILSIYKQFRKKTHI